MTDIYQIPPKPPKCLRKNCVTNTTDKEFNTLFDPGQQSHYCKTCGLKMKDITYYIAFKEDGNNMIPVSKNGVISLFGTLKEAKEASGFFGVGIATNAKGLKEIAERFGILTTL